MARNIRMNRKGLTGIETAIIVIAFVIAASVFAFAVLNMGLLTTAKAQDAIVSGVGQAQSSMKITSVYAYSDDEGSDAKCKGVAMLVQLSGTANVDFTPTKVAISYKNTNVAYPDVYEGSASDLFITKSDFMNSSGDYKGDLYNLLNINHTCVVVEIQGDGDMLLEPGEVFAIYINLANVGDTAVLNVYDHFTIEIIPGQGSKLTFTGTMPASILKVMMLSGS
ncbi:MAG: hypothetical protein NQU41_01035 [Candidatus Methanosuratincola sp.]|nr:hypothetical protein [Candidatus Methanosuratincola sp.]